MKFKIMAAVHILIFGEIAGCTRKIVPYIATHVKKSSKVCNIKVCNMKKILHTFTQCKYMGTISKYIIIKNIAYFHPV